MVDTAPNFLVKEIQMELYGEISHNPLQTDHPRIKPKSIMQDEIVEYFSKEYMYLDCIRHIHKVLDCFFDWNSALAHRCVFVRPRQDPFSNIHLFCTTFLEFRLGTKSTLDF